ncbi:hypothetical protein LZ480_14985 [Solibacillus sp. MA9]|uniref:ABC transporter permease n=1 Tax=Solibacillus palustris TaxID=2908203 RepID=A0ABS9UFN0_9BACL|nr:hypothetical protein [Solibacillus sp. MA9]MCH7323180.1 hypothetical protein [Solibacillus sp. MA9]
MKLIEIYIQEVTRRLPEKLRADIALELRSTIEDMLPDNYREEDVKAVLNRLGNPVVLANGYKDQPMHLIGPRYFDVYTSLLKMILPIATVIALITIITQYFTDYSGEEAILTVVLSIIGKGIGTILEVGIQVFFWITLTFAMIERFDQDKEQQPLTSSLEKWTADDLKKVAYIPKKKAISKFEVFWGLMWTSIWATLYFYANQLVGIYEYNGDRLEFVMPALNQEVLLNYWPFVVIIVGAEIALALYKLFKQQWTIRIAFSNAVVQIISTIGFIIILVNPDLLNPTFIVYMADIFSVTSDRFNMWIIGGAIMISILSTVMAVYDGYKKASIRS